MAVKKGTGQMKDSGFSRPYGPVNAKDAKKIADAIQKGSTKKPAPKKPAVKRPAVKPVPLPKPKPKPLTGPAAVKAMQDRVSPAGVKKAEAGAKKAIDKKYPGLYKK